MINNRSKRATFAALAVPRCRCHPRLHPAGRETVSPRRHDPPSDIFARSPLLTDSRSRSHRFPAFHTGRLADEHTRHAPVLDHCRIARMRDQPLSSVVSALLGSDEMHTVSALPGPGWSGPDGSSGTGETVVRVLPG